VTADATARLKAFYDAEMRERAGRPAVAERARRLAAFIVEATHSGCRSVVELGCGAGRDGLLLHDAGLDYAGIDLSTNFNHRSDATLQAALARLGTLLDVATWDWVEDGGHYQWARVEVGSGSTEFLGEPDENAFRPADIAEPVCVLVLDNIVADELRAVLAEPKERLVDVVHREHDT
jgi:hypothetical protein